MSKREDTSANQRNWTEARLEKEAGVLVKEADGLFFKFTSPNRRSVPDRLIVLPENRLFFVEFKAWGKQPTPGQRREILRLLSQGTHAYVIDNLPDFIRLLSAVRIGRYPTFREVAPPGVSL